MSEFLQTAFSWPVLPASVLLCLVTAYWLLVILGAADADLFDIDIDFGSGVEAHGSVLDWGLAGLKWFNLSDVPLMIWLSALAIPTWLMAMSFNRELTDPTAWEIAGACVRDFGIGLVAAKILTQPLKGKLKFSEPHPSQDLIGRTVVITTSTATPEFGQARLDTGDGAPLLLNVRTPIGTIIQGREARIVDYDSETRLFFVESIEV